MNRPDTWIELYFSTVRRRAGLPHVELMKSYFTHPHLYRVSFTERTPFKWQGGIIAICLLFVRAAQCRCKDLEFHWPELMTGIEYGTVEGAIRRLFARPSRWMLDLFGGLPLTRNLIGNKSRQRTVLQKFFEVRVSKGAAPRRITIRYIPQFLPPSCIKIFLDGKRLRDDGQLSALAKALEMQWYKANASPETAQTLS